MEHISGNTASPNYLGCMDAVHRARHDCHIFPGHPGSWGLGYVAAYLYEIFLREFPNNLHFSCRLEFKKLLVRGALIRDCDLDGDELEATVEKARRAHEDGI